MEAMARASISSSAQLHPHLRSSSIPPSLCEKRLSERGRSAALPGCRLSSRTTCRRRSRPRRVPLPRRSSL
ncbi:hypothetical protein ACP70R_001493 [Stipagrostis hirtigluma subsp. patula]